MVKRYGHKKNLILSVYQILSKYVMYSLCTSFAEVKIYHYQKRQKLSGLTTYSRAQNISKETPSQELAHKVSTMTLPNLKEKIKVWNNVSRCNELSGKSIAFMHGMQHINLTNKFKLC